MGGAMVFAGLYAVLLAALCVPFFVKKVEEELEIFLFILGCCAVTITSQWNTHLIKEALSEPVKITAAVFFAGLVFRFSQRALARNVNRLANAIGIRSFAFLVIAGLGLLSSVITAIIAALVLVEILTALTLDRKSEIKLVILACFAIGLGAALTPIGEPLSTIAIAKLRGAPYHADFFFFLRVLGVYILPGIVFFGLAGAAWMPQKRKAVHGLTEDRRENARDIFLRSGKIYLFVVALVLLGQGFKPVIDTYVSKIPYQGLYWINMLSAVLDNATLAAAEIGPAMELAQIKSTLLGLLIAGGMLIPGNIPNIIAAGKLKIKSSEWAKTGLPLGLAVMTAYFVFLMVMGI